MGDQEYEAFWRIPVNADWLEKKYQVELHNKNGFIRLYDLFLKESSADHLKMLLAKLKMFKQAIVNYSDPPLACHSIDWKKFPFDESNEKVDWNG